jgi:hypothetical protein
MCVASFLVALFMDRKSVQFRLDKSAYSFTLAFSTVRLKPLIINAELLGECGIRMRHTFESENDILYRAS